MIDVVQQIEAVERAVGSGRLAAGEAHTVTLRRTYEAPIEDLWDALTNPERIGRWFLPISGDYRLGGTYQFEGNAGGRILECHRPTEFKVTWEFGGGEPSEVVIRLAPAGAGTTRFEMVHTATFPDEMWNEYGPGAVGVGWEGGLLGLELHLGGGTVGDPIAWQIGPEGRDFNTRAAEAWGVASRAAGEDEETIARNVRSTTQFYAPAPEAATPSA